MRASGVFLFVLGAIIIAICGILTAVGVLPDESTWSYWWLYALIMGWGFVSILGLATMTYRRD